MTATCRLRTPTDRLKENCSIDGLRPFLRMNLEKVFIEHMAHLNTRYTSVSRRGRPELLRVTRGNTNAKRVYQ